jgi:hypothetical protein
VIPTDFQKLLSRPQNLLSAWALLTVATAVVVYATIGLSVMLLVLAGGALLLVIGLFWWSLHSLTGSGALTLEEALSMAAPSAEEEQKRAVLRALKDLELEKSLGKISDEDYRSLSASYRQQAKELIRALDANLEPLRAEIDDLVAQRMKAQSEPTRRKKKAKRKAVAAESEATAELPLAPKEAKPDGAPSAQSSEPEAAPESTPQAAAPSGRACPACAVRNDADARFCKGCGAALEDAE